MYQLQIMIILIISISFPCLIVLAYVYSTSLNKRVITDILGFSVILKKTLHFLYPHPIPHTKTSKTKLFATFQALLMIFTPLVMKICIFNMLACDISETARLRYQVVN